MDYGHLQRTRMLSSPKLLFSCRQGRLTWFPINFTPVYGMKLDIELHVENTEIWRECSSWDLQKKHMGIIWQQCLLIFLKNITWTFDFFITTFTIYHWSTNTAIIHAIEAYYQSYPHYQSYPGWRYLILISKKSSSQKHINYLSMQHLEHIESPFSL